MQQQLPFQFETSGVHYVASCYPYGYSDLQVTGAVHRGQYTWAGRGTGRHAKVLTRLRGVCSDSDKAREAHDWTAPCASPSALLVLTFFPPCDFFFSRNTSPTWL